MSCWNTSSGGSPRSPLHDSGGIPSFGSAGSGGGVVRTGAVGDGVNKKLAASVPPSEPSDMESDGDGSVHNPISYADIIRSEHSSSIKLE